MDYPPAPTAKPKLGRRPEHPIPVSRLAPRVRRYLKPLEQSVWLTGEIRDIKISGGHLRFTLSDAGVQLECIAWRAQALRLHSLFDARNRTDRSGTPAIRAGDTVVALGTLGLDERRVGVRVVVTELARQGVSPVESERERVRRVLEREGLLAPSRKRKLPRLPGVIALITSPGSAAHRDVEAVAQQRYPGIAITVIPAQVQGAGAQRSLLDALRRASQLAACEVILLCRGGGAAGELAVFDDEALVRAIALCPVPVVTGIGHETDITLADCVADVRAASPTAAATAVVPDRKELQQEVDRFRQQLHAAATRRLEREKGQLHHVRVGMAQHVALRVEHARRTLDRNERELLAGPTKQLAGARLLTERAQTALHTHLARALARGRAERELLASQLVALGPSAVLDRGYALALDDNSRVMASTADFSEGRAFTLRLRDGGVRARVISGATDSADRSNQP